MIEWVTFGLSEGERHCGVFTPAWSLGASEPHARVAVRFRCDRYRVRHVLDVVCVMLCSPLKASALNSSDEDSGKLMSAVANTQ